MSRRSARDTAFRLFFEYSTVGEFNPATKDIMRDCFDKGMNENAWSYVSDVLEKYQANIESVDTIVEANSTGWKINHMAKVELSILRLGTTELLYCDDIHESITMNECVELAKKYASTKSSRFVNGVLGAISKSINVAKDRQQAVEESKDEA
ncbi:MAG: transcription antitermination factor NusB [Clostridia bacterium]|nr:transcription antitermination factor NusB [Clostridia bacterium]MBT7123288.1 transcription antitermination factor NusB [Clostridia bacterium]